MWKLQASLGVFPRGQLQTLQSFCVMHRRDQNGLEHWDQTYSVLSKHITPPCCNMGIVGRIDKSFIKFGFQSSKTRLNQWNQCHNLPAHGTAGDCESPPKKKFHKVWFWRSVILWNMNTFIEKVPWNPLVAWKIGSDLSKLLTFQFSHFLYLMMFLMFHSHNQPFEWPLAGLEKPPMLHGWSGTHLQTCSCHCPWSQSKHLPSWHSKLEHTRACGMQTECRPNDS